MPRKPLKTTEPIAECIPTFEIVQLPLGEIEPTLAEYNPRTMDKTSFGQLVENIRRFGFVLPMVINRRTNRTVAGHQRFKAAKELKMATAPVHYVDLDEKAEKQLNIALNKIDGQWDYPLLKNILEELSDRDEITLSGFNELELSELFFDDEADSDFYEEEDPQDEPEEEAWGGNQPTTNIKTVQFSSKRVKFTCTDAVYQDLSARLFGKTTGIEHKAQDLFFEMIGLKA